jgi:hypothetical protein
MATKLKPKYRYLVIFGIFSLLLAFDNLLKHFIYFVEKMAVQVFKKICQNLRTFGSGFKLFLSNH